MNLSHALRITPGDVQALVGGGGKTTAMFQLANELASTRRVLTTTTTRIFAAQIKRSPAYITLNPEQQTLADILPQLDAAIAAHGQVLLIGQADAKSGKAFGLAPQIIDELAATGHFDLIINEADGSRMRSFKAPAAHEPVIPSCTSIVTPVVGLDALGQPLTDEFVHRADRVSHLSGVPLGQPVTVETIATVLCHLEGGLKNIPTPARVVPLLNKVDWRSGGLEGWKIGGEEDRRTTFDAACEIASNLLECKRIESVMIGAAREVAAPVVEVHSRAAAVILAAGGSTRFGFPKQLARWGHKTFIEHVADVALASQARPVIVVLGAEAEHCRAALADRPVYIVVNKDWAEGQSTSMRAGLAALPPDVGCALFLLVDLPGVTPEVINQLIQRHRQTLAPLIWPEFEGRRGNPVLFDHHLFAELGQIGGDIGGKPVLLAHQDQAERVNVAEAGILQDFDRPEDLDRTVQKS
jgi:molybdenum cofactor cytidylyltransferase